eukprot:13456987-Alexandrium_andersonii.AAC.1
MGPRLEEPPPVPRGPRIEGWGSARRPRSRSSRLSCGAFAIQSEGPPRGPRLAGRPRPQAP